MSNGNGCRQDWLNEAKKDMYTPIGWVCILLMFIASVAIYVLLRDGVTVILSSAALNTIRVCISMKLANALAGWMVDKWPSMFEGNGPFRTEISRFALHWILFFLMIALTTIFADVFFKIYQMSKN